MHSFTACIAIPPTALSRPVLGLPSASQRGKRKIASPAKGPGPLKSRKERALNSTLMEILDMVATKKQDAKEFIFPEQTKWGKIAAVVNEARKFQGGHVERDGLACKYKWQTLLADYKKVVDFHKGMGLVGTEYFDLRSKERRLSHNSLRKSMRRCMNGFNTSPLYNPPTPGMCSTHWMGTTMSRRKFLRRRS